MVAPLAASSGSVLALCLGALPVLVWLGNPALALLAGAILALALDRRPLGATGPLAAYSLQTAIVLLGLRLNLDTLMTLSAAYTWAVALYVVTALALGLVLGRLLMVEAPSAKLISAGTAICGGTAIATLSTLVRAEPQQMSVALAVVFLLNVVAVFTFPWVGAALGLSQVEFGLWAALAIHDTSSVLAAAASYGEEAAEVATVIKLGRTLWLIPLVLLVAVLEQRSAARDRASCGSDQAASCGSDLPIANSGASRSGDRSHRSSAGSRSGDRSHRSSAGSRSGDRSHQAKAAPRLRLPLFVLLFVAAAGVGSLLELPETVTNPAGALSRGLLVLALFLIGTELTRTTLRRIRGRALVQALALWSVVVPVSLVAVRWMV